jgi:protein required for attachment to host cells
MRRTWVLVGDGSRARLFHVGPGRDWELIRELEHPQTRAKARDLVTDRQGRVKQSASPMRSAMQLTKPLHAIEAEHFAHSVAKVLVSGLADNGYDQLVLVAPPHFLGLLRATIPSNVAKRVEQTLDKDYTALKPDELAERIRL